jgi:hypothetical protein
MGPAPMNNHDWVETPAGFDRRRIPAEVREALPRGMTELLEEMGGGEGFIGDRYLRLYRLEELASLNEAYETDRWFPGGLVFGSDGGGQAYVAETASAVELWSWCRSSPSIASTRGRWQAPSSSSLSRLWLGHPPAPPTASEQRRSGRRYTR